MLDEVEDGIVARYEILEHPTEHGQAVEAVTHQQQLFARPPNLVTAGRGVHSAGVKRVAIPVVNKPSPARQALERTRTFQRRYRWRAGTRGRIASLRRGYGWSKCGYHRQNRMERWVSWALSPAICAISLRLKGHNIPPGASPNSSDELFGFLDL